MEWFLILLAFAGLLVGRLFAIWVIRRGDRRFVWLFFAPTVFFAVAIIWSSLTLLDHAPVAGLIIVVVAVVNALLLVRMVRASASASASPPELGELSGPAFDFIVWGAIAVPFILVVGLIVLVLTVGFSRAP